MIKEGRLIHYPCTVDDRYFENTRLAHRALFMSDPHISYFKLQRALKAGKRQLYGHRIERVTQRLAVGLPLRPDDDGADLVLQPSRESKEPEHEQNRRLMRYPPGASPIERGVQERWH
jgi:hypothetical protein